MNKTHWKKLTNPDYLGAYALEYGKDLVVQIAGVGREMVAGPDGKKEECTVCHFTDKSIKPMILNVTNCKTIAKLYNTPFIEEWSGKYISVYIAKVRAFGDVVEALRVREKVPNLKKYICEDCGREISGARGKDAEEIAKLSKNQYGRELCIPCAKVEKEKIESEDNGGEESDK